MATSSTDYSTKPQSEKSVLERGKETISNTFDHIASKLHSTSSSGSSKDNLDKVLVDPNSTSAAAPAGTTHARTHSPGHNYGHNHHHGHNHNTEYAHTPIGYSDKSTGSDIEGHKSVGQKMTDSARHAKNKVEDKIDEHTSSNNSNTYVNKNSKDNLDADYTYAKPQHHGPTAIDTSKEYINVVKNENGEIVERTTETVHHGKGATTTTSHHTVASTSAALPAGSHSSA